MPTTHVLDAPTYADPAWAEHNRVIERIPATAYSFAVPAAAVDGDTIKVRFYKLPVGAKILGASFQNSADLDDGTDNAFALKVTDGASVPNTKTLLTVASGGAAAYIDTGDAATAPAIGVLGYVYNKDGVEVYLEITATTVSQLNASNMVVGIRYTLDTESGERTA